MTPEELRRVLEKSGISQAEAARRLGISDRTLRRYLEAGKAVLPRVELAVLRLLDAEGDAIAKTAKYSDSGRTVYLTISVSARRGGFQIVARHNDKKIFMTTVEKTGARAHRHLYESLSRLFAGKSITSRLFDDHTWGKLDDR